MTTRWSGTADAENFAGAVACTCISPAHTFMDAPTGEKNPPRDKQVAKPEPYGERRRAVLKESWSRSKEEWDRTVLCKGYGRVWVGSSGAPKCQHHPPRSNNRTQTDGSLRQLQETRSILNPLRRAVF